MFQPTPHQQARARRSAYAPSDEGEGMSTMIWQSFHALFLAFFFIQARSLSVLQQMVQALLPKIRTK